MQHSPLNTECLERYLKLLSISRRPPGEDALSEIVRAHLYRVPFENISKLYYKEHMGLHGMPDLELFLDGIERFNFGGTCYPNNFYLYRLLSSLGYDAALCGADMSSPDVHMVSMINLDGRRYLVDTGYAAPFDLPMPLDLTSDYSISLGRARYVLKPRSEAGRSRMEFYRDGELIHGYTAKPEPRKIGEFDGVINDSFRDEATFMNSIMLARFFPGRSVVIHNLAVIESRGTVSNVRTLSGRKELAQVITELFEMPPRVVKDVVKGLGELGDVWD